MNTDVTHLIYLHRSYYASHTGVTMLMYICTSFCEWVTEEPKDHLRFVLGNTNIQKNTVLGVKNLQSLAT